MESGASQYVFILVNEEGQLPGDAEIMVERNPKKHIYVYICIFLDVFCTDLYLFSVREMLSYPLYNLHSVVLALKGTIHPCFVHICTLFLF